MKKQIIILLLAAVILFSGCPQDETSPGENGSGEQGPGQKEIPGDLFAVALDREVELHWSAPENEVGGYNVYRTMVSNPAKEDFIKINPEPLIETIYTDSGLLNDLTYYYAITGLNAEGESPFSDIISVIPFSTLPPDPPPPEPPDTNQQTPPENGDRTTFTKCDNEKTNVRIDVCLKDLAISTKNSAYCDMLYELSKNECYYDTAIASNNSVSCEKISEELLKNTCIQSVAASLQTVESCLRIAVEGTNSTERDSCLYNVAVSRNSYGICESIIRQATKDDCYSTIGKSLMNIHVCGLVSTSRVREGFRRDTCYMQILNSTKDLSICPLFLDDLNAHYCYNLIANNRRDTNICSEISDQNRANNCFKGVAETKLNNQDCYLIVGNLNLTQSCIESIASRTTAVYALCDQIYAPMERNDCFYRAGTKNNDLEACKQISDRLSRNNCVAIIAQSKVDTETCEEIRFDPQLENECIILIAENTKDETICETIANRTNYILCYVKVCEAFGRDVLCRSITKEFPIELGHRSQDECFYQYAIRNGETETCNKILDDSIEEDCLEIIG